MTHSPRPTAGAPLDWLRAQARQPGEASFFWYDVGLRSAAVRVQPGEYFVSRDNLPIMTTLGSCVACGLWDSSAGVGGMNHFMLPDAAGDCGRHGAFAMQRLIDALLEAGAVRDALQAKVFGGGHVIAGSGRLNVGERNARCALDFLQAAGIPVVRKDVLDRHARKVCFLPASGRAMVKRLAAVHADIAGTRVRVDPAPPGRRGKRQ
jgi:chemotaxis protein CheD